MGGEGEEKEGREEAKRVEGMRPNINIEMGGEKHQPAGPSRSPKGMEMGMIQSVNQWG